ncbi:RsfA family transcriptional regulator [Oceanobacillus jeddahense]|uniref:RsfA family transcriptional regulator n=1 Tax=Oceanobacillus jeddahense TaxID=1462527 RepID=A0ABY5K228_9BACI|nr:RsfA family transcriptional regulator [Oceanobacillus jeddahense]UUI05366.1 RsfA family transcriptional regulator [Oceanobacillus jeddahense]
MVKVRQDAWSHEDDLLLAETVLRHIREGSTQLNAFEEVGDHLNRTSAACGFRWNAEVRNKYDNAIDLAKRQRKERKRALNKTVQAVPKSNSIDSSEHIPSQQEETVDEPVVQTNLEPTATFNLDTVIKYLKSLKKELYTSNQSKSSLQSLESENSSLQTKVEELQKKLADTEQQLQAMKEDYQTFIQIMDRARKMTVFEDTNLVSSPAFRMDKNGNLEQLAQGSN